MPRNFDEPLPAAQRAFLPYPKAAQYLGYSVSTLRRKVKAGDIPAPIKISKGRVAFRVADLEAYARRLSSGVNQDSSPVKQPKGRKKE